MYIYNIYIYVDNDPEVDRIWEIQRYSHIFVFLIGMFTIYLLHDDYIMMDINQVYTLVISDGENVPVLTHDQHSNHHPFRTIHSALSTVIIDPHLFLTFPIFNSIFSQRHAPSMQIFHICIYIFFFFDILQTYPHKMLPTHYQTSMNPSRDVSSGPLPPGP